MSPQPFVRVETAPGEWLSVYRKPDGGIAVSVQDVDSVAHTYVTLEHLRSVFAVFPELGASERKAARVVAMTEALMEVDQVIHCWKTGKAHGDTYEFLEDVRVRIRALVKP